MAKEEAKRVRGEWGKKSFCYDYFNFCPNCGLSMNEIALEILRKRESR